MTQQMMRSGTAADRTAALTLHVQRSPFHRLTTLGQLLGMARKTHHRQAATALETLKELFLVSLLPERKLRTFADACTRAAERANAVNTDADAAADAADADSQKKLDDDAVATQLCTPSAVTDTQLMLWLFEDALKVHFAAFVAALAGSSRGTLAHFTKLAMHRAFELLRAKPENEELLLKLICNKLGDPTKSVASKAVFLLHKLLAEHPGMAVAVADEIELVALQSSATAKTRYYASVCCAQLRYTRGDQALARRLIQMYLRLFGVLAQKSIDVQGRTLAALLTGINRALPYADAAHSAELDAQLSTLLHVASAARLNIAVQALSILLHVAQARGGALADRFFRALYAKLWSPELRRSRRQSTLLNLLFRALSRDKHSGRVTAVVKRVLQLALVLDAPFAAGALYLVSEIARRQKCIRALIHKPPKVMYVDPEDEARRQRRTQKSQKKNIEEPKKSKKSAKEIADEELRKQNAAGATDDENDVVEFDDDDDDGNNGGEQNDNDNDDDNESAEPREYVYDPIKLDPRFAHAQVAGLYELTLLAVHAHPSVRAFANTLLEGKLIEHEGNPIEDFALMTFLDRFVYRNPKQRRTEDPAGGAVLTLRPNKRKVPRVAVDSPEFLAAKRVAPADQFFKRYFLQRAQRLGRTNNAAGGAATQDVDIDSAAVDRLFDRLERQIPGAGTSGDLEQLDEDEYNNSTVAPVDDGEQEDGAPSKQKKQKKSSVFAAAPADDDDEYDYGDSFAAADFGEGDEDEPNDIDDVDDLEFIEDEGNYDYDALGEDDFADEFASDASDSEAERDAADAAPPSGKRSRKSGGGSSSAFADADEFADLLDQSMTPGQTKELKWAERSDSSKHASKRKRGTSRRK